MDKLHVTRVIGVEGFCNSGKSSVLKKLCQVLLSQQGARILHVYGYNGDELAVKNIDYNADVFVVIEVYGRIVVIVTGGDYLNIPYIVINVLIRLSIRIDVAFVAMRYMYPSVGDMYRKLLKGIALESVFKPGLKRIYEFPEGVLETVDQLWVKELLRRASINIDL